MPATVPTTWTGGYPSHTSTRQGGQQRDSQPVGRAAIAVLQWAASQPRPEMLPLLGHTRGAMHCSPPASALSRIHIPTRCAASPRCSPAGLVQDAPLPIGYHETISAPHMHATCMELLASHLRRGARVLDVGSGACLPACSWHQRGCCADAGCSSAGSLSGACDGVCDDGRQPASLSWLIWYSFCNAACVCFLCLCCTPVCCAGSGYLAAAMGLMVGDTGKPQAGGQAATQLGKLAAAAAVAVGAR